MQKVIIIGCPGSGKSTFGKKLNKVTEIPLYHLDMMYWNEDKTTVCKDVFLGRLRSALSSPSWIVDGNYGSTMEMRLRECDTVFFLDYPTEICLEGALSRRGKPRSDMPWFETDSVDEEFISFIENFQKESRPNILDLLKKYSNKDIIVFHSRKESQEYLNSNFKGEKL